MTGSVNQITVQILLNSSEGREEMVGSGILISNHQILTCAHVVLDALNMDRATQSKPTSDITIRLSFIPHPVYATVSDWLPCDTKPEWSRLEDVAILQLRNPQNDIRCLPLTDWKIDQYVGQPFRSFGFGKLGGLWVNGECSGQVKPLWIQGDSNRREVLPGCSGGPVLNEIADTVIGMLVAREPGEQLAYFIPLNSIKQHFQINTDNRYSNKSKGIEYILSHTLDRQPQIDIIEQAKTGQCYFFTCTHGDSPESLAHSLKTRIYLDTHNSLTGAPWQFSSIIVPPQTLRSSFVDDLQKLPDLKNSGLLDDPNAQLVVFTSINDRHINRIMANISDSHAAMDFSDRVTVLVGCYTKASILTWLKNIWLSQQLKKHRVTTLKPLSKLNNSNLMEWVDQQKPCVKEAFDCDRLKQDFWKLIKEGEQKSYLDIQENVELNLIARRK